MNLKKIFLFILCCFICSQAFTEEGFDVSDGVESLVTRGVETRRETSLTINSNVTNVEIYLNGTFAGYSNTKIRGLLPGRYFVELIKPGYEKESFSVVLRKGEEKTMYVYLKLITGFIEFLNYPSGAAVYVDGLITTGKIYEVGIGRHSVLVKKFGYEELDTYVTVNPYETTAINIELEEASFSISNFAVTRNKINPHVSGLGTTAFSFYVTADEPAVVQIYSPEGKIVRSFEYHQFTTWKNNGIWNGCDEEGNPLPAGNYVLKVRGTKVTAASELSVLVTVDDEMTYTLRSVTLSGGGIGTLPAAFHTTMANIIPFFGLEPSVGFNSAGITDFGCLLTTGVLFGIGKYVEGGVLVGGKMKFISNPYEQIFPFFANFSVKGSGSIAVSQNNYFNLGGLIRYGFSSEKIAGSGERGLGAGLIVGYETPFIYAGISSEFIIGKETGLIITEGYVWKNGLSLSFTPTEFMRLNGWFSLSLNDSFNFGIEYVVMPGGNGFEINLNTNVTEYLDNWRCNSTCISEKIVLSYSF